MNPITTPFADVLTTLSNDAKSALLALATQTHANIAANPTSQTVAAQGALLMLTVPTLLPGLQTDAITALNDAFLASFTGVLSEIPAPAIAKDA